MKNDDHRHKSSRYRIIIKEQLDKSWADWFGNFDIICETDDQGKTITILTGMVTDQAALNGVLTKIWSLNLTVLSVQQMGYK